MRIGLPVRQRVVVAVMRRPPQRAALHGRRAEHREQELRRARGAEGAVGEVTMVEGRDGEHAEPEQPDGGRDGHDARAGPDDAEAADVDQQVVVVQFGLELRAAACTFNAYVPAATSLVTCVARVSAEVNAGSLSSTIVLSAASSRSASRYVRWVPLRPLL